MAIDRRYYPDPMKRDAWYWDRGHGICRVVVEWDEQRKRWYWSDGDFPIDERDLHITFDAALKQAREHCWSMLRAAERDLADLRRQETLYHSRLYRERTGGTPHGHVWVDQDPEHDPGFFVRECVEEGGYLLMRVVGPFHQTYEAAYLAAEVHANAKNSRRLVAERPSSLKEG